MTCKHKGGLEPAQEIFTVCSHCSVNYHTKHDATMLVVGGGTHDSAAPPWNRYSYTHNILVQASRSYGT